MEKDNEELELTVRLRGTMRQRYLKIKEAKGLKNDSEVLRLIISEYYSSLPNVPR